MAPKFYNTKDIDSWWKNAYPSEHISVVYELDFDGDVIKPGNLIKIKRLKGTFKFRCFAHNIKTDTSWIDCIDIETGEWKSFGIERLKGMVKPKKSRRKKVNVFHV